MPLRRVQRRWVSLDGVGSLREQVARALRGEILDGKLAPGDRLPSTRTLAGDLGVSRTTTQDAYDQLLAEGYVETRRGSGTFVATDLPAGLDRIDPPPDHYVAPSLSTWGARVDAELRYPFDAIAALSPCRYEMMYGLPDVKGFPLRTWKRIVARRIEDATVRDLAYSDPAGVASLRKAIAEHLARVRGVRCKPKQVIVVGGAQQALQLLTRLLIDPGDRALIEEPCYVGARRTLLSEGAQLVAATVDDEGIDLNTVGLRDLQRCKLAYVTPSHQLPTGAVMSLSRRLALLRWAAQADASIIEDDYDGAFRFEGPPIESLQRIDEDGRVIYVGSFSKTMLPSLRIGYAVVPPPMIEALRGAKWLSDWACPTLLQHALADFMIEGHYDRHLRRVKTRLARRREALLAAIDRYLGDAVDVQGTGAGQHLLLWLNRIKPSRTAAVIAEARNHGVGIYPAATYYLTAPKRAGVLLGFAMLNERQLREAIKRLGKVVAK